MGDFLLVAMPKLSGGSGDGGGSGACATAGGGGGDDEGNGMLVLDTVIERKQLCDFKSTIASKRHYHSQKVRLARCGLARPWYLVEGALERWPHAAERARMQAELSTIEMHDGLLVHLTRTTDETMRFLCAAAARLGRMLSHHPAAELRRMGVLTGWGEFKQRTSPPEAVSFAFGRMLLNVHGLSAEMVSQLLARHPTPRALAEALDAHKRECDARGLPREQGGWRLAEELVPGKKRRKLSQLVTAFFCDEELEREPPPPDSQAQL